MSIHQSMKIHINTDSSDPSVKTDKNHCVSIYRRISHTMERGTCRQRKEQTTGSCSTWRNLKNMLKKIKTLC